MSRIFAEGMLPWSLVLAVVYLVFLLFLFDYLWRTTALGGRLLLRIAVAMSVAGVGLLFAFIP